MAIHIQNNNDLSAKYTDVPVHYIPCKIHASCDDAEVKKYFETYIKEDENKVMHASFRGYPLQGIKIKVPENYQGVILHESVKPVTETDQRKFYVTHKFNNFSYWNWDKIPSKNDALAQALDWIDIAEALHAPITEE